MNDEIFHKLTYCPENRQTLLPRLETLTLKVIDMKYMETELVRMVQSRWWPITSPTSFNPAREIVRLRSVLVGHGVSEDTDMDEEDLYDWCQRKWTDSRMKDYTSVSGPTRKVLYMDECADAADTRAGYREVFLAKHWQKLASQGVGEAPEVKL